MHNDGNVSRSPERFNLYVTLALACTASLGLLSLWTPFNTDQAIFVYGGRTIASGEALYRDFWDIKQPGIFFFYALAGRLFAFTEPGIHGLELLWQIGGALVLTWIARQCVWIPAAAALAPVATVGAYFAFTSSWHMTQIEALMGLPLALSLAMVYRLAQKPHSAAGSFIFGASVAIVGALKLLYLVIPAGFCLLLGADLLRRRALSRTVLSRMLGFGLLGAAIICAPLIGYFAFHGTLPELWWTTFGYPAEALRDVAVPPTERLWSSFAWTLEAYFPFSPLIVLGLATMWRARQPLLAYGSAIYLVLGVALIAFQRFSWWEYHQVLLFTPLGLLATLGLDQLTNLPRSNRWQRYAIPVVVVVLLAFPILAMASESYGKINQLNSARKTKSKASLSIRLDARYLEMWAKTRFIRRRNSCPGTVYVLGDARNLLLTKRRQAIAVRGHSWLHLPDSMWQRLPAELMAAAPTYVFLSDFDKSVLKERSPELLQYLDSHYHHVRRAPRGRWLVNTQIATEWKQQRSRRRQRKAKR